MVATKSMTNNIKYNAISFESASPQLQQLWQSAFGDSDDFITAFFDLFDAKYHLHTLSLNDTVLSALYALPFTIFSNGKEFSVAYIYAVATDEAHRGKGLMSLLMKKVHENLKSKGFVATVLLPASTWLCGYYDKLGYKMMLWSNSLSPKNIPTIMYFPLNEDFPEPITIHHLIQ